MPYAVDIWNEDKIRTDMQKAREAADFIVVCPHWGTEYKLQESKDQQQKAQFLADQGADLIIGTHPHVIEPVTWIQWLPAKRCLYIILLEILLMPPAEQVREQLHVW